jgi:hypothetical protein
VGAKSTRCCATDSDPLAAPDNSPDVAAVAVFVPLNSQVTDSEPGCYPPEPGKTRPKVVTIEVTRKGRLNLHKFDAALQAQLEGYLVSLGILQKGQTLNPQETPPSEDVHDLQPAFEH